MLQSWLLTNGQPNAKNSLAAIAYRELGITVDKFLQSQDWMNAEVGRSGHAMGDVEVTWKVFHKMQPRIEEDELTIPYEVELKALLATMQMESTGLYLDREAIDQQMLDLKETRKTALAAFVEGWMLSFRNTAPRVCPGMMVASTSTPKPPVVFVWGPRSSPGSTRSRRSRCSSTSRRSTSSRGIRSSVGPASTRSFSPALPTGRWCAPTWPRKKADKHLAMAQGLIDAQQDDGRIYARFNAQGTFTGRYSSSKPNLQNIPRGDMRYCFGTPEGRSWWIWTMAAWSSARCAHRGSPTNRPWPRRFSTR